MKRAPNVTRHGTPKDLADHGVGYVSSGEGEFSRRAAGGGNVKMRGYEEPKPRGEGTSRLRGPRSKDALIAENERALKKLRERITRENIPALFIRLKQQIEIKSRFIARLRNGT
jgi:hypothetical protein